MRSRQQQVGIVCRQAWRSRGESRPQRIALTAQACDDLLIPWSCRGRSVEANERLWRDSFERLREFKLAHGHPHVSKKDQLWRWVNNQRSKYKRGTLLAVREKLLLDIGFSFDGKLAHKFRERTELVRRLRASR